MTIPATRNETGRRRRKANLKSIGSQRYAAVSCPDIEQRNALLARHRQNASFIHIQVLRLFDAQEAARGC